MRLLEKALATEDPTDFTPIADPAEMLELTIAWLHIRVSTKQVAMALYDRGDSAAQTKAKYAMQANLREMVNKGLAVVSPVVVP